MECIGEIDTYVTKGRPSTSMGRIGETAFQFQLLRVRGFRRGCIKNSESFSGRGAQNLRRNWGGWGNCIGLGAGTAVARQERREEDYGAE